MKSISVIFGLVFLVGCSPSEPKTIVAESPALNVRIVKVSFDTIPHTQAVSGIVRPVDRAMIAANIMGTVKVARLAVGQSVSAGEILIEMKAEELDARLAQARASLAQADRDYARESDLEAKGAASRESVRSSEDRRRIARAAVKEAEAMQAYMKISAPFDGVITSDYVNPGDLASPGQPLFELEGTSHLRAEVLVPESLPGMSLGSTIAVKIAADTVNGELAELSPSTDSNSRTRLAKINLPPSSSARSGIFVRALWPVGEFTTLRIPATALSIFGQMERVFVVSDGRAQLRIVKTGTTQESHIEIVSGLASGEQVIIAPPSTLRDGQPVEIIK